MVLRAELPKTLIASTFKRYDPNHQDGRVSIRFVTEVEHVPGEKKNGNSSTVKFKFSSTVKKMYEVLVDGGTEAFIKHIKIHKMMLAGCKVREEAVAARSLIIANRRENASLTVADSQANQAEIENLVDANRELSETVCTL